MCKTRSAPVRLGIVPTELDHLLPQQVGKLEAAAFAAQRVRTEQGRYQREPTIGTVPPERPRRAEESWRQPALLTERAVKRSTQGHRIFHASSLTAPDGIAPAHFRPEWSAAAEAEDGFGGRWRRFERRRAQSFPHPCEEPLAAGKAEPLAADPLALAEADGRVLVPRDPLAFQRLPMRFLQREPTLPQPHLDQGVGIEVPLFRSELLHWSPRRRCLPLGSTLPLP
jgi:hypothetical protein